MAGAGLVVKAQDTGRVVLVQRSITHPHKHAAGKWEWPGGKVDGDEAPLETAKREFTEECACDLPDGDVVGFWATPDGEFTGFIYLVPEETDVTLGQPDGQEVGAMAWWDPRDLPGNPATRIELQSSDWQLIGKAGHENPDGSHRSSGITFEQRKKVKSSKRLTFGIDIDGTLTAATEQYSAICASLRKRGHQVVVVTARPNAQDFLDAMGFEDYDDLVLVDRGDQVGEDKAKVLKKLKADFMFENRPESAPEIAAVCPVTLQWAVTDNRMCCDGRTAEEHRHDSTDGRCCTDPSPKAKRLLEALQ
jgi:8-oxo-dGTP diphosphatase